MERASPARGRSRYYLTDVPHLTAKRCLKPGAPGGVNMTEPDLTRLPKGQLEWAEFVRALSDADDRVERYFLELKSEVDLTTEDGRAKVAKFVLGAANRMPDKAARRLGGYGLMVLGIAKGRLPGIPFFEAKDLAKTVKKYVGAAGPGWDFERIPVGGGRDVIVIVVDPPKWGDPVWTCLKDGHQGLVDGAIYVRRDGETSVAKGDEVRHLLQRAKESVAGAEIEIQIVESAYRAAVDQNLLLRYLQPKVRRLELAFVRANRDTQSGVGIKFDRASLRRQLSAFENPEPRSHDEYMTEIARWAQEVEKLWPELIAGATTIALPAARILVRNLSRTFLEDMEIGIHLAGDVSASWQQSTTDLFEQVPSPPRPWGPRPRFDFASHVSIPPIYSFNPRVAAPSTSDVSFRNEGSVDLTVTIAELRPESTVEVESDDFVLLVADADLAVVNGTWRATARGHHEVYEGVLSLAVEDRDITDGVQALLMPSDAE